MTTAGDLGWQSTQSLQGMADVLSFRFRLETSRPTPCRGAETGRQRCSPLEMWCEEQGQGVGSSMSTPGLTKYFWKVRPYLHAVLLLMKIAPQYLSVRLRREWRDTKRVCSLRKKREMVLLPLTRRLLA